MDHSSRSRILKQLALTLKDGVEEALEKEAVKISSQLETETDYDVLQQQIELLDIFAFRVSESAVGIVRQFLDRLDAMELRFSNLLPNM